MTHIGDTVKQTIERSHLRRICRHSQILFAITTDKSFLSKKLYIFIPHTPPPSLLLSEQLWTVRRSLNSRWTCNTIYTSKRTSDHLTRLRLALTAVGNFRYGKRDGNEGKFRDKGLFLNKSCRLKNGKEVRETSVT